MSYPRRTTVDDLNAFDIGCRVTFQRPASTDGRPVIIGKLLSVQVAPYLRGNIPRDGYIVVVQYASRFSWSMNRDEFGPLPSRFPITVGETWVEKDLSDTWESQE